MPAGNVKERSFVDIWRNGAPFTEIRERASEVIEECHTCDDRPYCNRCPGKAYQEDGNAFGASSSACKEAKVYHTLHLQLTSKAGAQ